MLEEKSKNQSGATTSAIQEIQERMNKITLDTTKSVNKIETLVKEVRTEVKNEM